jgi:hypothetical protein
MISQVFQLNSFCLEAGLINLRKQPLEYKKMYLTLTQAAPVVPETATMLIFGGGLIGLAGYGRKKHS